MNRIQELSELLGVELNEEFYIQRQTPRKHETPIRCCFYEFGFTTNVIYCSDILHSLILGHYVIIRN